MQIEDPYVASTSTTTPARSPPQAPEISAEDFSKACVKTVLECRAVADRIGYPVMIKASEGGGGKGIRRVTRSEDIAGLFNQVGCRSFKTLFLDLFEF